MNSSPSFPQMVDSLGTTIGLSKERRPIFCVARGSPSAPLKVLILAGQHGDERPARRTVESLLASSQADLAARLPNVQLAVVPEVNPDGCAARTRCTADGIDLNRDHQLLRSGEAMALHQFIRQVQPQVILDLHSYPSRRRHLLERNVVLNHDVFIDVPSHPAILTRPGWVTGREALDGLLRALEARSIRAARYTIVEASGRARHSTPNVVDARNGLALRYGAFTLLVENRQPRHDDTTAERLRLRNAQERALWTIMEWFDRNHEVFPPWRALETPMPGLPVPVRFKYRRHGTGLRLACLDADRGHPVSVTFTRYCASLAVRRTVLLPAAYAVPAELEALRDVLHRHGFESRWGRAGEFLPVQKLHIEAARPSRKPERCAARLYQVPHQMNLELDRYEIFPTRQTGGDALAVFLEPESQLGLHRDPGLGVLLSAPSWYPVLRVFDGWAQCAGCSLPALALERPGRLFAQ
jgi:hypothetical protein